MRMADADGRTQHGGRDDFDSVCGGSGRSGDGDGVAHDFGRVAAAGALSFPFSLFSEWISQ